MSRIAIMMRLTGGGTDHCSHVDGGDQPLLYPVLSEARAELQSNLKDVAPAVQGGHMEDDYRASDYFLHDTQTGRSYDVAWEPAKGDLLVRVSHQEVLSQLVTLLAEPGRPAEEHAFLLDMAQTALQFGLADHRDTVAILLPSEDGPNCDKYAIAPSSMAGAVALTFVDQACARANDHQAAIDSGGFDDDEMTVADRIDTYLEEAGFTVLSNDEGNLRIAKPWDAHEPETADEPSPSPIP